MSDLSRTEAPKIRSQTRISNQSQAFTTSHSNTMPTILKTTTDDNSHKIRAYLTDMEHSHPDHDKSEYLYTTHELNREKLTHEKQNDSQINLSDFIPEPKSLNQVIRLSSFTTEKWGIDISKKYMDYLTMTHLILLKAYCQQMKQSLLSLH